MSEEKKEASELVGLRFMVDGLQSEVRDMRPTYEFGSVVINRLVLPRVKAGDNEGTDGTALELLSKWLSDRDSFKHRLEECEKALRKVKCMYCDFERSLDTENASQELADHITACAKSPVVQMAKDACEIAEELQVACGSVLGIWGRITSMAREPKANYLRRPENETELHHLVIALNELSNCELPAARKALEGKG